MKTLLLILLPFFATAQKQKGYWQKQSAIVAMGLVAGFADAQREVITHSPHLWLLYVIGRFNLIEMENEKIAELVSKKIYNVTENETDFAVQLLIEKLTIPQDVKSYTADDAKKYILEALSKNAL